MPATIATTIQRCRIAKSMSLSIMRAASMVVGGAGLEQVGLDQVAVGCDVFRAGCESFQHFDVLVVAGAKHQRARLEGVGLADEDYGPTLESLHGLAAHRDRY